MGDLRAAVRTIAAHPWFAAAIILTLGVGIGINTTVFTLVNAVLFKPLPYPNGARIVTISNTSRGQGNMDLSYPDFLDLKAQASSFEQIDVASMAPGVISDAAHPPERLNMARVATGLFHAVGVEATAGRTLRAGDEAPGAPPVAVISDTVFRDRYNRAPGTIGLAMTLNDEPRTIVGVMPEGFHFPDREDVWVPFVPAGRSLEQRDDRSLLTIGLLKPGVSREAANRELSVIAARIAAAHPDTNKDVGAHALTFNERFNGGQIRTVFYLMIAAVGLVLLIACANVANMLLSRALSRQREMSIRSALGASRLRLIRQLLTESVLLSAAGGLLGMLVAVVGVPAFDKAVAGTGKPSWIVFSMDPIVMAYFAGICLLSALLFGLAPALRTSRIDLNHILKEGGRGGTGRGGWLSGTLVVLQLAFSVVLLTAAGLMVRSFLAGQQINDWIPRREILSARVELPKSRYPEQEARQQFIDAVDARLAAIPGVTHRVEAQSLPAVGSLRTDRFELEGQQAATQPTKAIPAVAVSPGYFGLLDLPITHGRGFDDRDGAADRDVAIVSRAFADQWWPNQNPLGKRLRIARKDSPGAWLTVVGVSGDLVLQSQSTTPDACVFLPMRQDQATFMTIAVRTTGDANTLAGPVRLAVQGVDPDLPLFDVQTYEALLSTRQWPYRVFGSIFGIFALSALLMASIGLYAVMSHATSRQTREIGVRMALGATPGRILRSVVRRGAIQLAIGLVLGLGAAFAATRAMRSLLVGVLPGDPTVFVSTSVLLGGVGLLACWLPARRAALIAPVQALAEDER